MGEHFTKVFNNHRDIDLSVLEELDQSPASGEIALIM
jgi:hypothetical protein